MAAYVIVNTNVHNPTAYEAYKAQAKPLVEQFGGKYLARGGAHKVIEGDWHPTRIVLLEFPTVAQAEKFFNSPEYAPVKAIRHANAHTDAVIVEGA